MTDRPGLPPLPTMPGPAVRRPPAGGARREWQRAEVVEVRDETSSARTLRLRLPVWHPHLPGQHYVVRLTAPDGYRAERSYSVASPPEDRGCIELTVERLADGEVSGYLHDAVRVGDSLEVRGPFGGWFVWRGDAPALLVGGGSGVVPLMAVLRSRRARGSDVPVHLVVSARSAADLFYADELLGEFPEQATVVLTREVPEGFGRPPGRLSVADLAPWVDALGADGEDGADVFVCGSTAFAGAAETLLQDAGVPAGSIRVERFGPS